MAGPTITRTVQASNGNTIPAGIRQDINTLVAGAVTCTVDNLTDESVIVPIREIPGGTIGALSIINRVNGVVGTFDISSTNVLDTSDVRWVVFG